MAFWALKRPKISPRPNHGGPRGVLSQGSEAKGKKCYTPKWGPEGSGRVRRGREGGLGQNQLRTRDRGIPGGDESPWARPALRAHANDGCRRHTHFPFFTHTASSAEQSPRAPTQWPPAAPEMRESWGWDDDSSERLINPDKTGSPTVTGWDD